MAAFDELDALLEAPSGLRRDKVEKLHQDLIPLIARFVYRTSSECAKPSSMSVAKFWRWLRDEHGLTVGQTTLNKFINDNRKALVRDGKEAIESKPKPSKQRRRARS